MNDDQFEAVMPFICVESAGGPHNDRAFCAGYQMGEIDGQLSFRIYQRKAYQIYVELTAQADLVGMMHGYTCEVLSTDAEWAHIEFTKTEMVTNDISGD